MRLHGELDEPENRKREPDFEAVKSADFTINKSTEEIPGWNLSYDC